VKEEDLCERCNYEHVCSGKRKEKHRHNCEFSEKIERHMFYPGGSPPRKLCPLCIHKKENCISSLDLKILSERWGMPIEKVKEEVIEKRGYILSEYNILEIDTMVSCDRFEEIE